MSEFEAEVRRAERELEQSLVPLNVEETADKVTDDEFLGDLKMQAQEYGQKLQDAAVKAKDFANEKFNQAGDKLKELSSKDPKDLIEDAKEFARQKPRTDDTHLGSGRIDRRVSIETQKLDLGLTKNTKKRPDFRAAFSIQLQILDLRMDQTPCLIAEKNVDLMRLDDGRDFAAAEFIVRHRLAFTILTHPVIGRRIFAAAHVNRGFDASRKGADRLASLA